MSKHTPGPWESVWTDLNGRQVEYARIRPVSGEMFGHPTCLEVATMYCCDEPEQQANARLIAAAPELLEALALCLIQLEKEHMPGDEVMHAMHHARAAICKAVPTPRGEE